MWRGYYEYLQVTELQEPRVLFAYDMTASLCTPSAGPCGLLVPQVRLQGTKDLVRIHFPGFPGAGITPVACIHAVSSSRIRHPYPEGRER